MEEVLKERLNWHGRFLDYNGIRYFNYSASGFSFKMRGKKAEATFVSNSDDFDDNTKGIIGLYVWEGYDDSIENVPEKISKVVKLSKNETKVTLFNESTDKNMCIYVIKLSEAKYGNCGLKSLEIDGSVINSLGYEEAKTKIEVIGDSITCGYGVNGSVNDLIFTTEQESSVDAYPFILARKLKAEVSCCSWSGIGITSHWIEDDETVPDTNLLMGSLFPYTDKELCKNLKIENVIWNEKLFSPDIVIINLGTNDSSFVRNKEDRRKLFVAFYKDLIEKVHNRSLKAKIICTYGVMEQSLCNSVKEAVEWFQKEFINTYIEFVPLELQKEEDGIGMNSHPSIVTQQRIADELYKAIKKR